MWQAIAVKVLVMEAIRKTVSSATGMFDARSARPCPWKTSSDPLRTTPRAKPMAGWRLRIASTLVFISTPQTLPYVVGDDRRAGARCSSTRH